MALKDDYKASRVAPNVLGEELVPSEGRVASIHRAAERDCLKKAYDAAQVLII